MALFWVWIGAFILPFLQQGAVAELVAGDCAVIQLCADNPDSFKILLFEDLLAGDSFFVTDNGVYNDGTIRNLEGVLRYTASSAVPAGTVLSYTGVGGDWTEEEGSFFLSTSGDQVIVFNGTVDSPTFLFALTTVDNFWYINATSSDTSALPPGLTADSSNAIAAGCGRGCADDRSVAQFDAWFDLE